MPTIRIANRLNDEPPVSIFPRGQMLPFVLVTVLFFIWGMSNNLTDILVQQFKKSFELSPVEAQLVQTAIFFGYACMALPAAFFMRRYSYKAGIVVGLCIFSAGTLLFYPAAQLGRYAPFLLALYVVGCGSATLETAANSFIAQFGSPETSERRLNFSQSFNPLGNITGVTIGTYFILSGIEHSPAKVAAMRQEGVYGTYLHMEILRVVPTYVVIGVVVLLFALIIGRTRFPAIHSEHEDGGDHGRFVELFRYPHLWIATFVQFCYCGAQFATWSGFIFYMKQYTFATERTAAWFLTGNLVALALGRFVSTWLMQWFQPARMMYVYAIINLFLVGYGIAHPGFGGAIAIMMSSFFMSLMFPTIYAMGIKGLGVNTKLGGSLLVMSVAGGGAFPPLLGYVAKQTGSYALSYLVPLSAYVIIAMYGYWGSRQKAVETEAQVTSG